jgi:uracil-DNA glycosylase
MPMIRTVAAECAHPRDTAEQAAHTRSHKAEDLHKPEDFRYVQYPLPATATRHVRARICFVGREPEAEAHRDSQSANK